MDEQTEFYYTIDMYGLLGGVHLGGVGGVVRALRGKGNAKDMNGSSVLGYMTKFSQSRRGTPNASSNLPVQITQSTPQVIQDTSTESPEFIPWNPQAFFGVNNNTPIIIQQEAPVVEEKVPTPEEIERQERQQGLANFQTIMGMLNNTSDNTSTALTPFESTVSMLTQQSPIHYFSDGGSIHIKPSHRGRFTALKERTGHSASWFKENGTPAQKKMAIFDLNSRHWKHGLGGNLFDGGGNTKAGIPVDYLDPLEVMPLVANNPNKSIVLDEVVVTPSKKLPMQSNLFEGITNQAANEKADEHVNRVAPTAEDLFTIGTLGGLSNLSPTQWARRAYDLGEAMKGNMSWDNFGNNWFYGNNGLVSDKYAQEHPYASTAINLVGDAGAFGTLSALRKLPKYTALMEAENRAVQEATAINWRDMFANNVRRTRIGDVEIDNPNLLYHLDRGDGAGAFSTQGAYVEDGFLFPGTPKDASDTPYSWWNKGKPYATNVGEQPMTRLMTTTEGTPGMLHVRSQNYPIGQWNGKKGFVLNSEFVSPEPVDVYNNTFKLEPGYGWRRVLPEEPMLTWAEVQKVKPFRFTGYKESPFQMHLKRAEAKGYDTSGINIYDLSKDTPENTAFVENIAKQHGLTPEYTKDFLLSHLETHGHAANINNTRNIIHDGTRDNLSARISHEIDHLLHKPDKPIPDDSYYPRIFKRSDGYFSKHNNTELSARGSQLHDYFGHTGNEPITENMLEYARQHYIKDTGLDNDMHDFLWTIKDNKKVADWLTKYATGIVPLGVFNNVISNQNKE